MLTGEQLRAGRAMLKMEQAELAQAATISIDTIKRLERMEGPLSAYADTVDRLKTALEREGVVFIPENGGSAGVRLRKDPPPAIRKRRSRRPGED